MIYGTDNGQGIRSTRERQASRQIWENAYADQWRYLASNDTVEYRGKPVHRLALPLPILRKLYHDNAVKWFLGLVR